MTDAPSFCIRYLHSLMLRDTFQLATMSLLLLGLLWGNGPDSAAAQDRPHLRTQGNATQLIVDGSQKQTEQSVSMDDYVFNVRFVDPWIPQEEQSIPSHGGLIIQTGTDEFFVGGSGITITFETQDPNASRAGIARIEEGAFVDGQWRPDCVLNGDQSHRRHLRLPPDDFEIQRLTLYRYH